MLPFQWMKFRKNLHYQFFWLVIELNGFFDYLNFPSNNSCMRWIIVVVYFFGSLKNKSVIFSFLVCLGSFLAIFILWMVVFCMTTKSVFWKIKSITKMACKHFPPYHILLLLFLFKFACWHAFRGLQLFLKLWVLWKFIFLIFYQKIKLFWAVAKQ